MEYFPHCESCNGVIIYVLFLIANDGFDYFGKCSHGGLNDESKQKTASGGINKEGTDPVLAPHYYHHVEAAELAILSTQLYFMSPGRHDKGIKYKNNELYTLGMSYKIITGFKRA